MWMKGHSDTQTQTIMFLPTAVDLHSFAKAKITFVICEMGFFFFFL